MDSKKQTKKKYRLNLHLEAKNRTQHSCVTTGATVSKDRQLEAQLGLTEQLPPQFTLKSSQQRNLDKDKSLVVGGKEARKGGG